MAAGLLCGGSALAQYGGDDPFRNVDFQTRDAGRETAWIPPLVLRTEREIPLPGPLPAGPLVVDDEFDEVRLGVAGGVAVIHPASGLLRIEGGAGIPEAPGTNGYETGGGAEETSIDPGASAWVSTPDGKRRFRTWDNGRVEAQRACRSCRRTWRRSWRGRIPAGAGALPLVRNDDLFVGGLDNQLYAFRTRNGHRLWSVDLSERLPFPPTLWRGTIPVPAPAEPATDLVLLVPDGGRTILVFEPRTGRRIARYRLGEGEGRLIGPARAVGSRIVAPRQLYSEDQASLLVFTLDLQTD
ncbi:hypothetical protein ABI59_03015 [Acidobacteria bacterium Mor1]|nr:hypothetical protein ABI59_03015 [Acidobacteria bacterium Mor1]